MKKFCQDHDTINPPVRQDERKFSGKILYLSYGYAKIKGIKAMEAYMSVFSKKRTPEEKKALETAYQKWQNENFRPALANALNMYAKIATIVFFGLVLLEYYIDLGAFYLIFPVFFVLHLALVLLFPAYFSLLPSYGKPKNEKESYPVGIFLMIPSLFPIFYLIRGASPKLWLAAALGALVLTGILLLRYRYEVKARFSFSIILETAVLIAAVFGALVMTNSIVAENNMIGADAVAVIEKTKTESAYTLTVGGEDGKEIAYNVSEAVYTEAETGDIFYIETYEGLFGIRFTRLTQ